MRKGDETKREILRAAEQLFCQKGYEAASMQEIVRAAGVSKGGIYHHFASKEEIMTLTTSRQFEQKIMNMIPFFIIVYVEGSSPGFFDQMYSTGMGRVLMTMCLILYLTAFWLSERILDIEV